MNEIFYYLNVFLFYSWYTYSMMPACVLDSHSVFVQTSLHPLAKYIFFQNVFLISYFLYLCISYTFYKYSMTYFTWLIVSFYGICVFAYLSCRPTPFYILVKRSTITFIAGHLMLVPCFNFKVEFILVGGWAIYLYNMDNVRMISF